MRAENLSFCSARTKVVSEGWAKAKLASPGGATGLPRLGALNASRSAGTLRALGVYFG